MGGQRKLEGGLQAANGPSPAPKSEPPLQGLQTQQAPCRQLCLSWGSCPRLEKGRGRNWLSLHLLGASSRCLTAAREAGTASSHLTEEEADPGAMKTSRA